jgi:hypothetical protein
MNPWDNDQQFERVRIRDITTYESGGGWALEREDGFSFFCHPDSPVTPTAGMVATFFGRGIGYMVRGLLLDGQCVFYRTEAEDEAYRDGQSYGSSCEELLARWDDGNTVWSVALGGFGPGYEQAIQLAGFEVLRYLIDHKPDAERWADDDGAPWNALRAGIDAAVGPIVEPLGLSGMQWGAALNIGSVFYKQGPVAAIKMVDSERRIQVCKNFPSLKPR